MCASKSLVGRIREVQNNSENKMLSRYFMCHLVKPRLNDAEIVGDALNDGGRLRYLVNPQIGNVLYA